MTSFESFLSYFEFSPIDLTMSFMLVQNILSNLPLRSGSQMMIDEMMIHSQLQVDNCHVETRAKCKDVTHNVPVPICDDQVQGPVIAVPPATTLPATATENEAEASAQSAVPRSYVSFHHSPYLLYGRK